MNKLIVANVSRSKYLLVAFTSIPLVSLFYAFSRKRREGGITGDVRLVQQPYRNCVRRNMRDKMEEAVKSGDMKKIQKLYSRTILSYKAEFLYIACKFGKEELVKDIYNMIKSNGHLEYVDILKLNKCAIKGNNMKLMKFVSGISGYIERPYYDNGDGRYMSYIIKYGSDNALKHRLQTVCFSKGGLHDILKKCVENKKYELCKILVDAGVPVRYWNIRSALDTNDDKLLEILSSGKYRPLQLPISVNNNQLQTLNRLGFKLSNM